MIKIELQEVKERYTSWGQLFAEFRENLLLEAPQTPDIVMNEIVLFNTAISYFFDIERYRLFHSPSSGKLLDNPENRLNDVKKAAYTVKWFVKNKPIQAPSWSFDKPDATLLTINEAFALSIALGYFEEDIQLTDEFYQLMIYSLKYRPINEYALILLFEYMKETAFAKLAPAV